MEILAEKQTPRVAAFRVALRNSIELHPDGDPPLPPSRDGASYSMSSPNAALTGRWEA